MKQRLLQQESPPLKAILLTLKNLGWRKRSYSASKAGFIRLIILAGGPSQMISYLQAAIFLVNYSKSTYSDSS